jgi:hypothetical protein
MEGTIMATHVSSTTDRATSGSTSGSAAAVCDTPSYRRPQLAFVGSVTRLVQSGPTGNRYETYRCSYWSDR